MWANLASHHIWDVGIMQVQVLSSRPWCHGYYIYNMLDMRGALELQRAVEIGLVVAVMREPLEKNGACEGKWLI